jgi:hypothetical protein
MAADQKRAARDIFAIVKLLADARDLAGSDRPEKNYSARFRVLPRTVQHCLSIDDLEIRDGNSVNRHKITYS